MEKPSCHPLPRRNHDCPDKCPGLLDTQTFEREGEQAVIIEICPNPATLDLHSTQIDYHGHAPDVKILYSDVVPTDEEYVREAETFDW